MMDTGDGCKRLRKKSKHQKETEKEKRRSKTREQEAKQVKPEAEYTRLVHKKRSIGEQ